MFKKQFNCIMIKTQDNKTFFTYKTNIKKIIEYVKNFDFELYLTKAFNVNVLDLDDLVKALCNKNEDHSKTEHKIIKRLYPTHITKRRRMIKNATTIRNFIANHFKSGKIVSLQLLKNQFQDCELSDSCLCNHISYIKKHLEKQGYRIKKVSPGKYKNVK